MKENSSDTIENRNRDLRACGAVPQPTAPTRAPKMTWITVVVEALRYKPGGRGFDSP